ncbi:hypothetical protein [uncultured Paraglaciecola sp.]|uniref:hypothetical protein n=1 Tax=uncultured Paraglaciecola sp. TaxID=1765024 RepID=UPI0030D7C469
MYANSAAFSHVGARQQAMGIDTRKTLLVDQYGNTVAHPKTGGMLAPQEHKLKSGTVIWRFASSQVDVAQAILGGWWVESGEFEKLCSFAQQKNVHVAMAARVLCCVPPEWSDMGVLIRARVDKPLLAYKGLGNNVSVQHPDGLGSVNMQAHNNIAARRLHQLYVPGLYDIAKTTPSQRIPGALSLERTWKISKEQANGGWIYI